MKPKKPKTTPVSIRVTAEERGRLLTAAGNRSLGDYIRGRLFGDEASLRGGYQPKPDAQQLAHILAFFGRSEIPTCLRELARAACIGALPVTPETEATISEACAATIDIRGLLMRALGLILISPRN